MARRATPVTKGRTAPKKLAAMSAPEPEAAKPARRGAKAKPQDEAPIEQPTIDSAMPSEDMPGKKAGTAANGRRGRKAKPEMMADDHETPEAAAELEDVAPTEPELPQMEIKAPKPPSTPRKTRRNREPEASAPPPLEMADEPVHEPEPEATPAAVEWHAETDSVTFDWTAIEHVAAAEGPNQPMAKLLLAARAEGARSRWPF